MSVGTLLPGPAVPLCGRGTFGRSFSSSDKAAIFAMGTCTPALRQNTVRTVSVGQRSREGPSRTSNIRSPLSVLNSHITERRFSRNQHAGLLQLRLLGPTLRTSNLIGLVGSEDAHLKPVSLVTPPGWSGAGACFENRSPEDLAPTELPGRGSPV